MAAKVLQQANSHAENATLYINLEPCNLANHHGSSCIQTIIDSGVSQVVIGMLDPNPIVNHQGIEQLKGQGIAVKVGILKKSCRALNESYIKKFA